MADSLFIKHKVNVKFMQECGKEGFPYIIIFCRVRKKDEAAFVDALRELPTKLLLCGHFDYVAQCEQVRDEMEF